MRIMGWNLMSSDKQDTSTNTSFYIVLGIILFVIVVLVGLALFSRQAPQPDPQDSYEYNGFTFTKSGNVWITQAQRGNQVYDLTLHYGPRQVSNIPIEPDLYRIIFGSDLVYIVLHDESLTTANASSRGALAAIEIAKIVGKRYDILNKDVVSGIMAPTASANPEIPVITCENATTTRSVVLFAINDTPQVSQVSPGCIWIQAPTGVDLIRAADRFLLQLTGIMLT